MGMVGLSLSRNEFGLMILSAAREAGVKGAPVSKLGRKKGNAEVFDAALADLLAERKLLELPSQGKKTGSRYIAADALPPLATVADEIRHKLRTRSTSGVTESQLKRPALPEAAKVFDRALEALLEDGTAVRRRAGKSWKYYLREHAPPTPEEKFCGEVLGKMSTGEIWLEDALAGGGKSAKAIEKRNLLRSLVQAGRLDEVRVVGKAKKIFRAFCIPSFATAEAGPTWPEIEQASRELARSRYDGAVSFEDLAERLGTSTLYVKTAFLQQLKMDAPIQLIEGDPREARDPSTAALERDQVRYLRFRFLDR